MSAQRVGVNLSKAYTNQDFNLGELHVAPNGNHYIFMQADGAVDANKPYSYDPSTWQIEDIADAAVIPLDATVQHICFPPNALADNEYGWVMVGPGFFTATTDATGVTAADSITYISATVGTLSSGATAALLKGVRSVAVITGGAAGTFYAANRMYSEDLP